jgi:hypothetical protein
VEKNMFPESFSHGPVSFAADEARDAMIVCANGHVVTDRSRANPELQGGHCDRCGAPTFSRCQTCGTELPGAPPAAGLVTVGQRQPPRYCSACGSPFPWAKKPAPMPGELLPALEKLLRRLPRTIRELKLQAGSRPPFRMEDERDLEYLLRAVLPLCCDEVRLHNRTPAYASFSRTDFLLMPDRVAVTTKLVTTAGSEDALREQWCVDTAYYAKQGNCRLLLVFVLDQQGLLGAPEQVETRLCSTDVGIAVRCVVAQ